MDSILYSIKNIFRKKLRTFLTISGIAIGVLSVVLISIIGEVGKSIINNELNSVGINGICIGIDESVTTKAFSKKELNIVQKNENVVTATPFVTGINTIKVHSVKSKAVVWGIDSNASKIVTMSLLNGRLINKSDVAEKSKVCIVDEKFSNEYYNRTNIVGKTISISMNGAYNDFQVVGVVSSGGNILQSVMGELVPTFVYIPYTTQGMLTQNQSFNQIVFKTKDGVDETQAVNGIIKELGEDYSVKNAVKIENINSQKEKLNSVLNIITMVLAIIGSISLLVAGLSIMTVMLVTVNERTREIGIKKSIGASRRTILFEFLIEALLLTLIGSIIGTSVAVLISVVGCLILKIKIIIPVTVILFCIAFSLLVGVIFGVYPAVKASKLKPVDALRYE